jgi:hypothetical protein
LRKQPGCRKQYVPLTIYLACEQPGLLDRFLTYDKIAIYAEGDISMKKAILMGAALMLCTALALAQDTPSSGTSSQSGASTSSSDQATATAGNNTVQGCLTGTSGNYMLTDASGVMYQLTGDESQLSANVNKQVEVTGTAGAKASASATNSPDTSAPGSSTSGSATGTAGSTEGASGASANANAAKTLEVTSINKVADSCSAGK